DSALLSTIRAMSLRRLSPCRFGAITTFTFVPARPERFTLEAERVYPPTRSFLSRERRWAGSTPRSTRAPRTMSPLIPEKQSKYSPRIIGLREGPAAPRPPAPALLHRPGERGASLPR